MPKCPRILEKRLEDGVAAWCCYDDATILIDPRQSPRQYLDSIIHELLHWVSPDWKEAKVKDAARLMTRELWKAGYRRTQPKTK
jgi:hypothetical protein